MSAPHMHENGGWTICDRDDCDVMLARRRAGEIREHLVLGVVVAFASILTGTALLGSNWWSRAEVILPCGVLYLVSVRHLLSEKKFAP
jgi:hypothetical protein